MFTWLFLQIVWTFNDFILHTQQVMPTFDKATWSCCFKKKGKKRNFTLNVKQLIFGKEFAWFYTMSKWLQTRLNYIMVLRASIMEIDLCRTCCISHTVPHTGPFAIVSCTQSVQSTLKNNSRFWYNRMDRVLDRGLHILRLTLLL